MPQPLLAQHYGNAQVVREIVEFLRGRWVAVHCERRMRDGRPLLVRYLAEKPLAVNSEAGFASLLKRLRHLGPRAFYGTASLYKRLETREDALNYSGNVVLRTLTWDIDSTPEHWRATLEVARLIVGELEREGVSRSVWLKWSGRGMHVHVHEKALPEDLLAKRGALDVTWSAVQMIVERVKGRVQEVNLEYGSRIKVENLMDPQRVFTAPLSLHRELDAVCVALKPDDLDEFDPSWAKLGSFRHNPDWRVYEEGEAIELAEKALREIGGYLRKGEASRVSVAPAPRAAAPVARLEGEVSLSSLRIRENPGPLYRRKLLYDPRRAVEYLEDILSHYILGNIEKREAESLISSTMNVTLLTQGYTAEDTERLRRLYAAALEALRSASEPDDLRRLLERLK
ncbi:hypothetical protein [Infirmifilum sp. SLHALR2]|nr:MAG: hypothetical protein B7L53_00385 [Thermofilum sp. NZ13]